MAKLVMNKKENEFEKQTYSIIDADRDFCICTSCKKIDLTQGYFCQSHKCLFCIDCVAGKNEKRVVKCRGVAIHNPVFANKGISATECVYIPIKEIEIK